jgi:Fe-S-cluster-containing hydrogenase component 2
MSFLEDGIVRMEDIQLPTEERFNKGPVIVIECVQEIPCNPCVDSCSKKAIVIEGSINGIPRVVFDRCTGCGICIANCPGLAIFIIDKTHSKDKALLSLPYEFFPLPEPGETVDLLDRAGAPCGEGRVVKVRNTKAQDRTPVISLEVDKEKVMDVRFFRWRTHDAK